MRESLESDAEDVEEEEEEGGGRGEGRSQDKKKDGDTEPQDMGTFRSSSVDTTSSSSMADAVEEARRMSNDANHDDVSDPLLNPITEIHRSKPIIPATVLRRKKSLQSSGSSGSFEGLDDKQKGGVEKGQERTPRRGRAGKEKVRSCAERSAKYSTLCYSLHSSLTPF